MRTVKIKIWIPAEWPEGTYSANQNTPGHYPIKGTAYWSDNFIENAHFHRWSTRTIESEQGNIIVPAALIELPDGRMDLLEYDKIKFDPSLVELAAAEKEFNEIKYNLNK